jgi:hypothetical protein
VAKYSIVFRTLIRPPRGRFWHAARGRTTVDRSAWGGMTEWD